MWDYKLGKPQKNIQLKNNYLPDAIIGNEDNTFDLLNYGKNIQCIDSNSNLLGAFNRFDRYETEGFDESFYTESPNEYLGWKLDTTYKLPSNIYRLSLYNKEKEFHTYIQYDTKTWKAIENYEKARNQRLKEIAENRQQEEKLLRTFEINKMGIYNWDIFYDKSEVVTLKADFELDNDSFNINATDNSVFLITGQDRNVVIKNPSYVWDKFQFNPVDPNMLLIVLPNNRIAVLSEEGFGKIDLQVIKKTGKHTFKLKVLDAIRSKEQLDKIIKDNSKPA